MSYPLPLDDEINIKSRARLGLGYAVSKTAVLPIGRLRSEAAESRTRFYRLRAYGFAVKASASFAS